MKDTTLSVLHSGNAGDLIAGIPTIVSLVRPPWTGLRWLLRINMPAGYQPGVVHPLGSVTLNEDFAWRIIPLLRSQGWEAEIYDNQPIHVAGDMFRYTGFFLDRGDISNYYTHAFPLASPCFDKPWLAVQPNPKYKDTILVTRTQRYRNRLSYSFLRKYPCVFLGLPTEHEQFQKEEGFALPRLTCKDFLEMAEAIAGCRLLVANQTFAYHVAEALKVPRILEVYPLAPNVIPKGNGIGVISQVHFEEAVRNKMSPLGVSNEIHSRACALMKSLVALPTVSG